MVVLELDDADFLQDEVVFQAITGLLDRRFEPGVQFLPWREMA